MVINHDVAKLLEEDESSITAQRQLIEIKKQRVDEFQREHDIIQEAACQFSLFLKRNSIAAYNDATIEYLDQQIREERGKMTRGGKPDRLDRLEASRQNHEKMVKLLEESMKHDDGSEPMDEKGVQVTLGSLYKLPHYGENLMEIKRVVEHTHEASCREKSYSTKADSHWASKSVSKKVQGAASVMKSSVSGIQGALSGRKSQAGATTGKNRRADSQEATTTSGTSRAIKLQKSYSDKSTLL